MKKPKAVRFVTPAEEIDTILRDAIIDVMDEHDDLFTPCGLTPCHEDDMVMSIAFAPMRFDGTIQRGTVLVYNPGMLRFYKPDEIAEIVRHEYAHTKNGDNDAAIAKYDALVDRLNAMNASDAQMTAITKEFVKSYTSTPRSPAQSRRTEFLADITLCKNHGAAIRAMRINLAIRKQVKAEIKAGRIKDTGPHPKTHPHPLARIWYLRYDQLRTRLGLPRPKPLGLGR